MTAKTAVECLAKMHAELLEEVNRATPGLGALYAIACCGMEAVKEVREERDDYRDAVLANMAGCSVPANVSGNVDDTGDCTKCPTRYKDHCLEYQIIKRYAGDA